MTIYNEICGSESITLLLTVDSVDLMFKMILFPPYFCSKAIANSAKIGLNIPKIL